MLSALFRALQLGFVWFQQMLTLSRNDRQCSGQCRLFGCWLWWKCLSFAFAEIFLMQTFQVEMHLVTSIIKIVPFLWEWNKYLIWCWVWVSRCQSWVMTQGLGEGERSGESIWLCAKPHSLAAYIRVSCAPSPSASHRGSGEGREWKTQQHFAKHWVKAQELQAL